MNQILTALIREIELFRNVGFFTNRYGTGRQKSLSSDCTLFMNANYAFRASSGISTSQPSDGCDIDMRTSGTTWSYRLMAFENRVCNMLRL
jgi:hypothetical protein